MITVTVTDDLTLEYWPGDDPVLVLVSKAQAADLEV